MGQKVNPIGLRLGIVKTWESRWYAGKNYASYILEDHNLRKFLKERLYHAGISRIEIERSARRIRLRIFTARPGIVIGKKGATASAIRTLLKIVGAKNNARVNLKIEDPTGGAGRAPRVEDIDTSDVDDLNI